LICMPCYHPILAYRTKGGDVTFKQGQGVGFPFNLPCGRCIGCKLERSRQWAVRLVHEASLHSDSCAITLTYDDEHLPANSSLHFNDVTLFIKRLRRRFSGLKIKYYYCGEYGDRFLRPHYHAIFFGLWFSDTVETPKKSKSGFPIMTSKLLDEIWHNGQCTIDRVTFENAAYAARYCLKKITGEGAAAHYGDRVPEDARMSLRPAIGKEFLRKYENEIFPDDFVVCRGRKMKPPRYYSKLIKHRDYLAQRVKFARTREASGDKNRANNTPDRLKVRETVNQARISLFKRDFEE